MPSNDEVVNAMENYIGIAGQPQQLVLVIEHVLRTDFSYLEIQASEAAEQIKDEVEKIIVSRSDSFDRAGVPARLIIFGAAGDMVCGGLHISQQDAESLANAKRRRMLAESLCVAIQSLSFQEFEKFGGRILKELGVVDPVVTPHSNDQGIDFFGTVGLSTAIDLPENYEKLAKDIRLIVVGQAKRYNSAPIQAETVRAMVGAVVLQKSGIYSNDSVDIFRQLNMKLFSPVVGLLFTTGTFSSGADRIAEEAGIHARTGYQLAVYLADKNIGIVADQSTQELKFDQSAFNYWLHSA